MEETESIYYIIMLSVVLFVAPAALNKNSSLVGLSEILLLGAVIFIAIAMVLISIKKIPFLTPYIKIDLADNLIKLLAWIGVLLIAILIILFNTADYLQI